MLRKLLFTALLFLSAFIVKAASEDKETLYLSYCDGKMADENGGTVLGKSGAGTIEAAIMYPEDIISVYAGNEIVSIRFALATVQDLQNVRCWLRSEINGENIVEAIVEDPSTGWNEVTLPQAYLIEGQSDLYIGYSFYQTKKSDCISFAGETSPNGCWFGKDRRWSNMSSGKFGSLSIEGVVVAANLPDYNLSLSALSIDKNFVKQGEALTVKGTVKNSSLKTVDGYKIEYTVGNGEKSVIDFTDEIPFSLKKDFSFEIGTQGFEIEKTYDISIKLLLGDGNEDDDMSDNSGAMSFAVYERSFDRKVVLEQFTTENCGYCPAGAARIKSAMDDGYKESVIWVSHHAGFGTDWLTINESQSYTWFYGPSGTFAPAMMLDRTYLNGFCQNPYPVTGVSTVSDIKSGFESALKVPAFVNVKVSVDGDKINLSGEKLTTIDGICSETYLTVMITEDNITDRNQSGATGDYIHNYVPRKVLTQAWGDEIAWTDNKFETSFPLDIDSEWVRDEVRVVAFIHSFSSSDRNASVILNADAKYVSGNTSVNELSGAKEEISVSYYSTLGQPLQTVPQNGIYLKVIKYSDGTVNTIKTVAQ